MMLIRPSSFGKMQPVFTIKLPSSPTSKRSTRNNFGWSSRTCNIFTLHKFNLQGRLNQCRERKSKWCKESEGKSTSSQWSLDLHFSPSQFLHRESPCPSPVQNALSRHETYIKYWDIANKLRRARSKPLSTKTFLCAFSCYFRRPIDLWFVLHVHAKCRQLLNMCKLEKLIQIVQKL